MTAPVIRHDSPDFGFDHIDYPVDAATTIAPGQFLSLEGGEVVLLNAAAEDATFAGISKTGHSPNIDNRDTITITELCIIEVDTVAAAYTRGAALSYSSGSGASIILGADANANTLAWAMETKTTDSSNLRLKVLVDVKRLAQNADKLWDTVSA